MSSGRVPAGFDRAKAEGFAGRFLTALNDGALCLMVSAGHRVGLFDTMSTLPPANAVGKYSLGGTECGRATQLE